MSLYKVHKKANVGYLLLGRKKTNQKNQVPKSSAVTVPHPSRHSCHDSASQTMERRGGINADPQNSNPPNRISGDVLHFIGE
jgi:hypothetical protein